MFKVLLLLVVAACASARTLDDDVSIFADFKATFGRQFSPSEEAHRFKCFRQNLDLIEQRNALGAETHAINKFADLCADEFKVFHNLDLRTMNASGAAKARWFTDEEVRSAAASVDWRQKGAVTKVKDQGHCGSCWSFSTTGNVEGQWFLAGNTLVGLSEQELVSCSHNGNMGCNGGLMDNAFKWIKQNGGIDSEADYPYKSGGGSSGSCINSKLSKHVAKISSYVDVGHSESQMATWIAKNGPLSIAVDAQSWQTYHGGIMSNCNGHQLDHGVLAVGYGSQSGTDYWIIKNSWSTSWGENGYIRVAKGSNQCGINQMPSSSQV